MVEVTCIITVEVIPSKDMGRFEGRAAQFKGSCFLDNEMSSEDNNKN